MASTTRKAAVAGSWYPESEKALAEAVDQYLAAADTRSDALERLVALIAPHAGLIYSGPVAAHAYKLLQYHTCEVAVLVGPSHFVAFEGVSLYRGAGFETPFG